jgi:hypothetical protein
MATHPRWNGLPFAYFFQQKYRRDQADSFNFWLGLCLDAI